MKSPVAILAVALAAAPAAAQTDLSAAYEAAKAAVAARPAAPLTTAPPAVRPAGPASCDEAKELETKFDLTLTPPNGGAPVVLRFEYAGCEWADRNDYLPPYTTREYKSKDGDGLTIITNDGDRESEILLSKGKDWVGDLHSLTNEALASGDPVAADVVDLQEWRRSHGTATLRNAAKPLYPQLKACETADWSKASAVGAPTRDASGGLATGYGGPGPSLVLLTKTAAYYYHEDCDICAEVTKCELSSGALSSAVAAHSVDCEDMKPFRKDAVFDACPR